MACKTGYDNSMGAWIPDASCIGYQWQATKAQGELLELQSKRIEILERQVDELYKALKRHNELLEKVNTVNAKILSMVERNLMRVE